MIGRERVKAIELTLGFGCIAHGKRAHDAVGQHHDRIVEKQIHLRCALRRHITAYHQLLQVRISAHAQQLLVAVLLRAPSLQLLYLLLQADATCVVGCCFQLRPDFFAAAHQHVVEYVDIAATPALIILISETPRADQKIQCSERALFHELCVYLCLQRRIDSSHGANKACISAALSCDREVVAPA
jgi:hypothetical protein